ncbi:MAG: hypothetical protein K0Q60_4173 [Microvirga sp.]|jgi:hypothetical protein|nr:hypothetical protein [Microvirga sp.]
MASRAQLVREILKELGVYQAGQDLPPEDYHVIDDRLDFEVASLYSQNIYSVDDIEIIPDEALIELAKYIAGNSASLFGLAGEELRAVQASQAAAERALRFLRTMPYTGARQRAEYF